MGKLTKQSQPDALYIMELLGHLRRQFSYDSWANRQVFDAIAESAVSSARPVQLLAHILSAERLWLERVRQQPQSLPVWPNFTLAECAAQINELPVLWTGYFDQLSATALEETIAYQNSKGEQWTSSVEDILSHVLLHSAYHRGQIASEMRREGNQPAYTDFIHAARRRLIE